VSVGLEHVIVDRATLAVRPIADLLLGSGGEEETAPVACSHQLALHRLELRTTEPVASLAGVAEQLQAKVVELNARLEPHGAALLPGGMHPFMDPRAQTRLWPHAGGEVYARLDRAFDCRRHGWANLQSLRLELPFASDAELARLHAALRALLPLLPALAASSPLADGAATGLLDTRLEHYRTRAERAPALVGAVIPEPCESRAQYEREVLAPIGREIAPHDPDGVLRGAALDLRGLVPRFERGALELRLLDAQECPAADLAIAEAVVAAARALCEERSSSYADQCRLETPRLANLLREVGRDGERARVHDTRLLGVLGFRGRAPASAGDVWAQLIEANVGDAAEALLTRARLDVILRQGPLARRMLRALEADQGDVRALCERLRDCLARGRMLRA
jgi:gamma-glutamyl:cysteine ligase YbdK (ATP-grasp superfamily)